MRPLSFARVAALLIATGAAVANCSKNSPGTPSQTTTRASVSITSIGVNSSRLVEGGFGYRVVVHLRESGGAAATIKSVDLTFLDGTNTVVTSHFEQLIPATNNTTPANGVADTRELVTNDTAQSHPYASSVTARVTYTDASAVDATVTGSAATPPLSDPPPPITYTLRGIITEEGTSRGIEGARVEAVNGANAGKATLTDAAGSYTLNGLSAETFRMRASITGFDSGEQNVTVPDTTRADMALRRTAAATCAYTVTPAGPIAISSSPGSFAFSIARTSGSCGWQASSNASWITLGGSSGSGDANLTFSYQGNASFVPRIGTITVSWDGGSAAIEVRQAGESPAFCRNVAVTATNLPAAVPTAGGTYNVSVTPEEGTPPGACGSWSATASAGITFGGGTSTGPTPGGFSFTVAPNGTGSQRTLSITVSISGRTIGTVTITQQ